MNEKFVADRITELRMQKGISEYKLSEILGFSKSYINNISRHANAPSIGAFLAICDCFGITPIEFFLPEYDSEMKKLIHKFSELTDDEKKLIMEVMDGQIAKRMLAEQCKSKPNKSD